MKTASSFFYRTALLLRSRCWVRLVCLRLWLIGVIFSIAGPARAEERAEGSTGAVRIIFFLPSDLAVPDGVRHRITKIADAADAFLLNGMKRHGHAPGVETLFRRDAKGEVELLHVRGDDTAASGKYSQPNCVGYVIDKARQAYNLPKTNDVWWVFVYLGDRPKRYDPWAGRGNPPGGGWAIVNYDTVPGEIRPDLQLTEGFNFEYKLKSTIHELVHGFGLPHMGPDPTLGLGNSLMGPNPPEYAARSGPKADHVYLAASEAAMLWKHPFFTGKAMAAFAPWEMRLTDYRAVFDPTTDTVTVSGKLSSQQPAHSVVLIDDRGDKSPTAEYWSRSYAARLASDGSFQIRINDPAKVEGEYRILFCFDNGTVTGNGSNIGPTTRGDIRKKYGFRDGQFHDAEQRSGEAGK